MTQHVVFVINSGSSSTKYQLVDPDSGASLASGLVERTNEETGAITHRYGKEHTEITEPVPDHDFGLSEVLRLSGEQGPSLAGTRIVAVGHRVVQGGRYFSGPVPIDDDVVARVEQFVPLGPLYSPAHPKGIEVGRRLLSDVLHMAVFDTAFSQDLPEETARHTLDRGVADTYSVCRCRAHDTNRQFVSGVVSKLLGCNNLKQVVLHLGNGVSASVVVAGHAMNTSIGLAPLEGLVMGGRTGDIDPVAVFHLVRVAGMSIDEIDHLFNRGSGMKGLVGGNDIREVRKRIGAGEQEVHEAMDIYLHRLVRYVSAYTAVMGGLDTLTFIAGIGESDANLCRELGKRPGLIGVKISQETNETRSDEPCVISTPDPKVVAFTMPTNEKLAIACQALTLI